MKIAPKTADQFIASLAAPARECNAALIYGVDNGMVRERAGKITKSVLGKAADDPFARIELSEAEILADPARLADELSAVSMMCAQRLIIINNAGDKLTKIIEGAAPYFHKSNFLLLAADELAGKSSLRAFFEKSPACAALACYRDEMRDVQSVIRQQFEAAGISCDRNTVDYLAGQLGNDRYVTYMELEKLITYAGEDKKLSLNDVRLLVDYNQDTQLDDIVNAVADRNLATLEKYLTQHLRGGTSPIMYLRALQRYFSRLYSIRAQMQQNGQSADMVVSGLRPPVFFKQQPILTRHANSWNIAGIAKALKLLITAELDCKTSDLPAIAASSRRLLQITQIR